MNNIIILGAGAMGMVIAQMLKQNKQNDITLVGRDTIVNNVPEKTIIIVCVKANDLKNALYTFIEHTRNDTIIICLQNGIGIKDIALQIVQDKCIILRGLSYIGTAINDQGYAVHNGGYIIEVERSIFNDNLLEITTGTQLNFEFIDTIKKSEYKKAMFNAVLNPLTVMFNCKNGELVQKNCQQTIKGIIDECLLVCKNEDIMFEENIHQLFTDFLQNIAKENTSSMLQDIKKERKTEINFINGKWVALGKRHGIEMPLNKAMMHFIENVENSWENND